MTLGAQAEKFGRDYLEVVARGDDYYAIELGKDYANRFPTSMDLQQHYALSDVGKDTLREFQSLPVLELIRKRGPGATWVLDQPIRIKYSYGREQAELVWRDPSATTPSKIHMFLEYIVDGKGNGQWHVEECMVMSKRYVAPSIL